MTSFTNAINALSLCRHYRHIVFLNHQHYEHVQLISDRTQTPARACLIRDDDRLYLIWDYQPDEFSLEVDPDADYTINKQLLHEWQLLSPTVAEALMEYMLEVEADDRLPRKVVYCGHGYGAALAMLQCAVTHPDELYTFGLPPVGDEDLLQRLRLLDFEAPYWDSYVLAGDRRTRLPWGPYCEMDEDVLNFIEPGLVLHSRHHPRPSMMYRSWMHWQSTFTDFSVRGYLSAMEEVKR